jgi:predicted ATPase
MSTVSVSKVTTKNYKNIRLEEGLDWGALTVLIGANGSGKSNVISLFQFLQESVAGAGTDDQRGRTNFEDAVSRLGGARILDGTISAPANVNVEYQFASESKETTLGIELLVPRSHHKVIVEREFLDSGSGYSSPPAYYRVQNGGSGGSGSGVISVFDYPHGVSKTMVSPPTHLENIQNIPDNELAFSVMPRLLESSSFAPDAVPLYGPRGMIKDSTVSWRFYNANSMNVNRIKFSDPKLGRSDLFVSPSGENLVLVIYNLIHEDFEFEESLNQMIKDILPVTRKIRALSLGRIAVIFEWHVEGCSDPLFLDEMSDGTVRMLCWAVILNSPKLPSLIVIEEPELGIHPAWMPILAEWIKRAAQKTQVIVTTHSPDLLDHFTDQLDDGGYIYTFQQDSESQNHFRPRRLDRETVSGWIEDGWQVGDLYRVGNPAVGGWPW